MKRVFRSSLGVLSLTALCACASAPATQTGAGTAAGPPGVDRAAGGRLYVCNQDDATVSIVDLDTREVIETVDLRALGFSENAKPHHVAVEPDGSHWYVSLIGEGRVVKLDRGNRVVASAPFETPGMLALHPTRDRLYVGRSMTAVNPPRRIGVIRRSDMSIEEIDVFFPRPHAMALDPATGVVYTASLGVNQIAAVDPESESATLTDVEGPPQALMQFAVSPDGTALAISGEVSHTVHFFDITADPLRPRHVAAVEVASQPFDPVFSRDGSTVWLGNKAASRITAIDARSHEVVRVLDDPRIRQPHGAAASPDGRWILISNTNVRAAHDMGGGEHAAGPAPAGGAGSVAVIDAATRELVDVIEVGRNATGIAVGR